MSKEEKVSQLIDALTLTALGAVEQVKSNQYTDARARNTDMVDRMRLDVDFWFPLIRELRKSNRIPSAKAIREKAESMVNLTGDEMRKVMSDYHKEVKGS